MPYIAKAKLEKLLYAGGLMATTCFNLKQLDPDKDRRELFHSMQERWDTARSALRDKKVQP